MDIPAPLKTAIEEGNVVLMLGAGASLGAKDSKGNSPPTASQLASILAHRFLSPDHANYPLTQVGDFAASEGGLFQVQDFLADLFKPFEPSPAHKLLPSFRWRAIVTTNYDCLVEDAYRQANTPAQKIAPLLRNTDHLDRVMHDPGLVPLIKLHGCITNTHELDCPLVLSTDTYANYAMGKDRLFRQFMELASERPILYLGYGLQDQNIRSLLEVVSREQRSRPRSFLVTPSIDDIAQRFWSNKQITALAGTFSETIEALDNAVGKTFRGLRKTTPKGALAISSRFAVPGASLSETAEHSLTFDLDFVQPANPYKQCDPVKFYSGNSHTWAPIIQELDVRRKLHDTLILDYVLDESTTDSELIVIKGHAGAGKSVFLRRLAWEAARDFNKLCLFAQPDAELSSAAIGEIITLCKERVFLFVDDLLIQRTEIERLLENLGTLRKSLTIVGGARTNEWNSTSPAFQSLATKDYPLPYLNDKEIDKLVDLLEQHNALRALEKLSKEERRERLKERAGRQILVALHEATSGKTFTDILHDEFHRLTPDIAKKLYLSICMLNQFNVPVRAGIIARRFGITFEDFKTKLFKPLEDVVITVEKRGVDDYCYTARHPHVAEIVVRNELRSMSDLFNEFVASLSELNLGYSSDQRAFQRMTQAKLLAELFSDQQLVFKVFEKAEELAGPDEPFLMQQMALFEMNRDNGNLTKATALLEKAIELRRNSRILKHSLAELYLRKAEAAKTDLERKHFWSLAERICRDMKRDTTDSYPYCTLVKTGIQRLRAIESDDDALKNDDVGTLIKQVEQELKDGLQRFLNDSFLLAQEAALAKLLSEWDRVFKSLQQSFSKNHSNSYVALQLAAVYEEKGDLANAQAVLKDAIDAQKMNARLHHIYGKFLLRHKIGTPDELLYHFKHAYTPGDTSHDAQLLHARQLFVSGEFDESRQLFKTLSRARIPIHVKRQHSYPLDGEFEGVVSRQEAWYCQFKRDRDGGIVQFDFDDAQGVEWRDLVQFTRVSFKIAFTMFGPEAFDVKILGR